jgi:hypothetical protein
MLHDPEIGRVVHIDASGYHSRAVLHLICDDNCKHANGRKHVAAATSRAVKESRWAEGELPPETGIRHPDAARVIAARTGDDLLDDEGVLHGYAKVIEIGGHRYGLHDAGAGVRSYKQPDGTTKESWIGGYDIVAIDGKYGAKLQGMIAPNDRQECNLYFPLMRRLHGTLKRWPDAVTGDRGQSLRKTFRFNTRRGVASVFAIRRHKSVEMREEIRCEQIDEHGVVRCPWCGSECEQFALRAAHVRLDDEPDLPRPLHPRADRRVRRQDADRPS